MLKSIEENPQESRKEWMLWMFEQAGKKNSNVKFRQFWQQNNKPSSPKSSFRSATQMSLTLRNFFYLLRNYKPDKSLPTFNDSL
ncbi:hypothetical protein D3C86_1092960 [compost metagenome]